MMNPYPNRAAEALAEQALRDILLALGAVAPYANTTLTGTNTGAQDATSTFTSWGTPIGAKQNFNRVKIVLRPFDAANLPSFVRVRVRQGDHAGTILGDAVVPVSATANADLTVLAELGATIANASAANLWLEFATNGRVGFHGVAPTTYPAATFGMARYGTALDLTTFPTATATGQRNLWAECSLGEVLAKSELSTPNLTVTAYPYSASTFSAWGVPVGAQPAFNRVQFIVKAYDAAFLPARMRVRVRQTNHAGAILAERILRISPTHNADFLVTADFDQPIGDGATQLWLELCADGRFWYRTAATNPYPTPTYPATRYGTTGGIDGALTLDAGTSYNLWAKFTLTETNRARFEGAGAVAAAIRALAGAQQAAQPFAPSGFLAVPTHLYAAEGVECNVYWDGIFRSWLRPQEFVFDVACAKGRQENDRFAFTPSGADAGETTWSVSVSYNGAQIATSGARTLRVAAANAGDGVTRKLLAIGDSTTQGGVWTGELLNLFGASDPMNIALVGTVGSGSNFHEGHSGKTLRWFRTDAASPFVFSGVFDFGSYLTTHSLSLSANDWALVHLGINDVFPISDDVSLATKMAEMLADLNAMVANMRAAVSGLRIGVCLTIPPARNQDAFGDDYGATYLRARYVQNIGQWREFLIANLSGQEASGFYLIPTHGCLDTVWNFPTGTGAANARNAASVTRQNNGVHPDVSGYYQFADAIYAFLKYWA